MFIYLIINLYWILLCYIYHITAKNILTKRVYLCCEMLSNEDIKRDGEIIEVVLGGKQWKGSQSQIPQTVIKHIMHKMAKKKETNGNHVHMHLYMTHFHTLYLIKELSTNGYTFPKPKMTTSLIFFCFLLSISVTVSGTLLATLHIFLCTYIYSMKPSLYTSLSSPLY